MNISVSILQFLLDHLGNLLWRSFYSALLAVRHVVCPGACEVIAGDVSQVIDTQSQKKHNKTPLLSQGFIVLAASKQIYEWLMLPFCPSVCPSVRLAHLFTLCSHHRIIMKFPGVITNDQGGGPCKRSSDVKRQGHWGQNPT